jgi:hypothetical protein
MSEPIKFNTEELESLKSIQIKYQENTYKFGQLYLNKLMLDEQLKELNEHEEKIKSEFKNIKLEEDKWIDKITTKYGEGNLNIKDGTFTQIQKQ